MYRKTRTAGTNTMYGIGTWTEAYPPLPCGERARGVRRELAPPGSAHKGGVPPEKVGRELVRPLLEDAGQCVELLGNTARLADDVGQRHDLHLAVAPDGDHPTLTGRDQLHRVHAEARRPDAISPRRRTSPLQMTEHSDAGLEACFELDPPRQRIADSALGELDMPERVRLRLAGGLLLELGDMRAFRDHDDAEELALAAAPG